MGAVQPLLFFDGRGSDLVLDRGSLDGLVHINSFTLRKIGGSDLFRNPLR